MPVFRYLVPLCLVMLFSTGCANRTVYATPEIQPSVRGSVMPGNIDPRWVPLFRRLTADGYGGEDLSRLFTQMQAPSPLPMGRKITELYKNAFTPKPKPSQKPVKPTPRPTTPPVYSGVITAENIQKCQSFLAANKAAFDYAEQRFGVPREVAVSLMFVETRLGAFFGKEKAFYTLASMAASRSPNDIPNTIAALPDANSRLDWIQSRMEKRSDWAYKELVALLENIRASHADPLSIPGSIYGAIGYCQFMPSNLVPYGADGSGDGVVDLFTVPDAAASLSNYLKKHGWKTNSNRAAQHKVIKTYNHSNIYANTILALAQAQGYTFAQK